MTDEEFEPFRLGGRARVAGEPMAANPYRLADPNYKKWLSGWLDMEDHLSERDAALRELGW